MAILCAAVAASTARSSGTPSKMTVPWRLIPSIMSPAAPATEDWLAYNHNAQYELPIVKL